MGVLLRRGCCVLSPIRRQYSLPDVTWQCPFELHQSRYILVWSAGWDWPNCLSLGWRGGSEFVVGLHTLLVMGGKPCSREKRPTKSCLPWTWWQAYEIGSLYILLKVITTNFARLSFTVINKRWPTPTFHKDSGVLSFIHLWVKVMGWKKWSIGYVGYSHSHRPDRRIKRHPFGLSGNLGPQNKICIQNPHILLWICRLYFVK